MSLPGSLLGVVFDLDGTLVDSRLDFAAMRQEMGLGPEPILEQIAQLSPERRAYCEAILERHEVEGARRATLLPGAAEWTRFLDARNIRRAIFSRNSTAIIRDTLARVDLTFTDIIGREDGPPKPDPAGIRQLCGRWRISPQQILVVGDYLYDIEAGRAAGARTALVTLGRPWPFSDRADHVWPDLSVGLAEAQAWFCG